MVQLHERGGWAALCASTIGVEICKEFLLCKSTMTMPPNIMRLSWFLLWLQCAYPSSFQCTTLNSWCMPPLAPNAKVLHCFPNDTAKEHSKQTRSEVCPNSFLLTSHANCAGAKLLMTVSCKGIKPRTTGTRSPPTPSWARCRVTKAALMGQSATSKLETNLREPSPTRSFSWLKAPTSAFTFKTLLRHYATGH